MDTLSYEVYGYENEIATLIAQTRWLSDANLVLEAQDRGFILDAIGQELMRKGE